MPEAPELPALIILAAGESSRMGEPKGLVQVGGESLWLFSARRFTESGGRRVILVLGRDAPAYVRDCGLLTAAFTQDVPLPWPRPSHRASLRAVMNPDPARGPMSSLQLGLVLARGAAWILPVDCPAPRPSLWREWMGAWKNPQTLTLQPTFGGRAGHPVGLSADFAQTLWALDPRASGSRLDERLRALEASKKLRFATEDAGIHRSFNTPEEWATLEVQL